jgi:5-(carboxyamino)imidazole ribonucleotide synthase
MASGHRVGIVGGGQLAVMMADAADDLGLEITSLAQVTDDPIFSFGRQGFVGDALAVDDLRRLAEQSDVLTFDHELVDYRVLAQLETEGVIVRPGSTTMAIATDKERQFELFERLGIAQPDTVVVSDLDSAFEVIARPEVVTTVEEYCSIRVKQPYENGFQRVRQRFLFSAASTSRSKSLRKL